MIRRVAETLQLLGSGRNGIDQTRLNWYGFSSRDSDSQMGVILSGEDWT
jgi:hypothetical protein